MLLEKLPLEAEELFSSLLKKNLAIFEVLAGRGAALARLQRYAEAADCFEQANALQPNNEESLQLWASCAELSGNKERAAAAWKVVAGRLPSHVDAWRQAALMFESLGRHPEQLDALVNWSSNHPSPEKFCALALAQYRLGRHSEALSNFERAEAMEPGFLDAHEVEGSTYREIKPLQN